MSYKVICADVLDWAASYEGPPYHALLADPPYHLGPNGFMGKDWDAEKYGVAFNPDTWAALAEHLHPGAFGMAFASARGWHRLACAIEDAGLRIHPAIFGWAQGSGFPKATRIDTQIDKAAGAEREVVGNFKITGQALGKNKGLGKSSGETEFKTEWDITAPATPLAQAWAGHRYGLQAMKPALEPLIVFSKPQLDNLEQLSYNELQDLVIDIDLILEELWTRFASNAESISRAEAEVNTVLKNVQAQICGNDKSLPVYDVVKNSLADPPKSQKGQESTVQENVTTKGQEKKSPASSVENSSTSQPQSCDMITTDIAAGNVTEQTTKPSDKGSANIAEKNSPQIGKTEPENTAPMNADTHPDVDQCLKTRLETETDTDIITAILRYNSEKAKCDLSTIWLWSITWADVCARVSRSITAMNKKTITELRTLSYLLRKLTLINKTTEYETNSSTELWSYATDVNNQFSGLLTSLKALQFSAPSANNPHTSLNPIILFQKPYSGRPVESIVETGAGALWVDGGRVSCNDKAEFPAGVVSETESVFGGGNGRYADRPRTQDSQPQGRWPANLVLTHIAPDENGNGGCERVGVKRVGSGERKQSGQRAMRDNPVYGVPNTTRHSPDNYGEEQITDWRCEPECPVRRLGEMSGERPTGGRTWNGGETIKGNWRQMEGRQDEHKRKEPYNRDPSTGTAARFYFQADWSYEIAERLADADPVRYVAKAARKERDAGLEGMPEHRRDNDNGNDRVNHRCQKCNRCRFSASPCQCEYPEWKAIPRLPRRNFHPTVKPIALTRWLAALLLPPDAYAPRRILIPFAGSGSEMIGAGLVGWEEITGIEFDADTCAIAQARLEHWLNRVQLELL